MTTHSLNFNFYIPCNGRIIIDSQLEPAKDKTHYESIEERWGENFHLPSNLFSAEESMRSSDLTPLSSISSSQLRKEPGYKNFHCRSEQILSGITYKREEVERVKPLFNLPFTFFAKTIVVNPFKLYSSPFHLKIQQSFSNLKTQTANTSSLMMIKNLTENFQELHESKSTSKKKKAFSNVIEEYMECREFNKAIIACDNILNKNHMNLYANLCCGFLYRQRHEFAKAETYFNKIKNETFRQFHKKYPILTQLILKETPLKKSKYFRDSQISRVETIYHYILKNIRSK